MTAICCSAASRSHTFSAGDGSVKPPVSGGGGLFVERGIDTHGEVVLRLESAKPSAPELPIFVQLEDRPVHRYQGPRCQQRTPPHGPRWQMPPHRPYHQSMNRVVSAPAWGTVPSRTLMS